MRPAPGPAASPPWEALRERLTRLADTLEPAAPAEARALRETVEAWWREQQAWGEALASTLSVHHEINNALVGVRGNAQLVLIGPHGREVAVRERMEVVIRESDRIHQAAGRLRDLKAALVASGPAARAA